MTLGDLTVVGSLGSFNAATTLTFARSKSGVGGSVTNSTITADSVGSFKVANNLVNSKLLVGTHFGSVEEGTTLPVGAIGRVAICGNVSGGSVIAAGLGSLNGTLKDADDYLIDPNENVIKSFTIVGTAAPDSYYVAGRFVKVPVIGIVQLKPAEDLRFKVA